MTMEVDGHLTAVHKKSETVKPRWRKAIVGSSVVFSMLIAGSGLLPPVLLQTALRDRVLGSGVHADGLTATSSDATGGWLAPLIFRNVRIADANGGFLCTITELRTSRGLLGFLTGGTDIGQISLVEPHVEIHVDQDGHWPRFTREPSNTQLSFSMENGSLLITVPWRDGPIVDVDDLAITGHIRPNAQQHRVLTLNATQVFDHEPLSEAHTRQNLALIAPVLSQSTHVSGSASVWLDEIQIPLDGDQRSPFPISGRAEFHSLEARLKEDWTRQLTSVTGQLTGKDLPDRLEVLKDSRVDFTITDEGITHQGMVFLLPKIAKDLQISSSGIVRLDESLDLQLTVTLPQVASTENRMLALLARLTTEPLKLAVTGTVSEPHLGLPESSDVLGEISKRVTPAQYEEDAPPLPSAVMQLIQGVGDPNNEESRDQLTGNVLNLIRAIDKNRKENPKERPRKAGRRNNRVAPPEADEG